MSKNHYQTYTADVHIGTFRTDFVHRGAICGALAPRYPDLAGIATECEAIVKQIDTRMAGLQDAEDNQIRARAIEDAEKIDAVDVYTELRRTMAAKNYDVATILPDAPSALRRLNTEKFTDRAMAAVANLKSLSETDPMRVAFLANLEKELTEFQNADKAEDAATLAIKSGRVALTLYKAELAEARNAQLGTAQAVLKHREKVAMLTLPLRKSSPAPEESSG